jgi:vacuolar protein sorting-associated protein 35
MDQDEDNLREALKCASLMLGELRATTPAPRGYYELYIAASDELMHLRRFFGDKSRHGRSCVELYELVQHAGNILPRLYLLITVGATYVELGEGSARDVLMDLVEMTRGVQQPMHGLFLRAYLSQMSKGLLPDKGSRYEGEGGNIDDAVEFLLQNFTEMNKLWVRMQHIGPSNGKKRREGERQELRDLVGKNLLALSQLEGVDLQLYRETVLPRILEQVVNCKDELAQPYLLDVLIQVFPDEYHLATFEEVFSTMSMLRANVRVGSILNALLGRLLSYAEETPEAKSEFEAADVFPKSFECCQAIIGAHDDVPAKEIIGMYAALMAFARKLQITEAGTLDDILLALANSLQSKLPITDPEVAQQLSTLLSDPLESCELSVVLSLKSYPKVIALLDEDTKKKVALGVVQTLVKNRSTLTTVDHVKMLYDFIECVVSADAKEASQATEEVEKERSAAIAEEQNVVARVVHLIKAPEDNHELQLEMLNTAYDILLKGGPRRIRHTFPALVFAGIACGRDIVLAERAEKPSEKAAALKDDDEVPADANNDDKEAISFTTPIEVKSPWLKKSLHFVHKSITALTEVAGRHEKALKLFLEAAQLAAVANLESIAYEFFERAFVLYEENITDTKKQVNLLFIIIGTLHKVNVFGADSRESLVHKTTGYSARLLKKPDQCVGAYTCAHLFWTETVKDSDSVASCLKKSVKIANAVRDTFGGNAANRIEALGLYVGILNKYLYFYDKTPEGCTSVTVEALQALIDMINTELSSVGDVRNAESIGALRDVEQSYANTLTHIRQQKHKVEDGTADRYSTLVV